MRKVTIKPIEIDEYGKLHIKPYSEKFTLIYRTAKEVHWYDKKMTLYSPKPKEWSYRDWYNHNIEVAKAECSAALKLTDITGWRNISNELKNSIIN